MLLECNGMRARIIDDFLADPAAVRAQALAAQYVDWPGHDGAIYKRVCLLEVPQITQALQQHVGPIELFAMGFRLNYDGELPNAAIHSDAGWGTHALVLYLCDGPGGTAFWRHKATGATELRPGDEQLWHQVRDDWDRVQAWQQVGLARMKFNRAVIYEGSQFHSRWPFAAFGSTPQDGRLIAVAFFTPRAQA